MDSKEELRAMVQKQIEEMASIRRRNLIRRHATEHQRPANSLLEKALWGLAKWSPFSGKALPTDFTNPYMLRTYLTPDGLRIKLPGGRGKNGHSGLRPYLHYLFRSDSARALHNHPWRISYSLILSGGYTEFKLNPDTKEIERRVLRPGSINVLRRDDYHRVDLLDAKAGCWTLFCTIDRLHESDGTDWGFLGIETGNYMPWGEYNEEKEL